LVRLKPSLLELELLLRIQCEFEFEEGEDEGLEENLYSFPKRGQERQNYSLVKPGCFN
jgi:hypothetical protein